MSRDIKIGVADDCQNCDLMKVKSYSSTQLPYCTLFKTYLQFREYDDSSWITKPCYECMECNKGNTHYFTEGEYEERD